MWQAIIYGIVCGIFVAGAGYFKSSPVEKWEPKKFTQTIIIGAVVGAIAAVKHVTYAEAYEWAATVGVITIIEYLKKGIWRWIKRLIGE